MKNVLNFIKNLVIFVYIFLIIFITICLLSYNDYQLTVFGKDTLIPIIDDNLEPNYTVGDLLIVKKNTLTNIHEGDVVFFYRTVKGETTVNFAKLTQIDLLSSNEATFTVEGDYKFSSMYFIGKEDTSTVIPNVGTFLSIIESKWGFLFLGVFPSLIAFLYTLYSVILELREKEEEEKKKKKKNKKKKEKLKDDNENVEEKVKEEPKINETKEVEITKPEENVEQLPSKVNTDKIPEKSLTVEEELAKLKEERLKKEPKIENLESKEQNKKTPEQQVAIDPTKKTLTNEQKKILIEQKMKTMTPEEKKALIQAKLNSMTDEEKRALIEAKKKKMEEQKK